MNLRLALICHAPTTANRSSSFPGDEPLDGPGLKKARAVRSRVSNGDHHLRSPALAAQQTAEALNVSALIEPDLRECDYGQWAGRQLSDIATEDPAGLSQWLADPDACPHGGETLRGVIRRAARWLDGQLDHAGVSVAITHASFVRAAIISALEAPPLSFWRVDISPLSITWLHRSERSWTLSSVNERLRVRSPGWEESLT